jgi:hypothetical protein
MVLNSLNLKLLFIKFTSFSIVGAITIPITLTWNFVLSYLLLPKYK